MLEQNKSLHYRHSDDNVGPFLDLRPSLNRNSERIPRRFCLTTEHSRSLLQGSSKSALPGVTLILGYTCHGEDRIV